LALSDVADLQDALGIDVTGTVESIRKAVEGPGDRQVSPAPR
jgi:hypothetical protein